MLVLTQKLHSRIKIEVGDTVVWVSVVRLGDNTVRLGFEAPPEARITRNEVLPVPEQYPDGVKNSIHLERSSW